VYRITYVLGSQGELLQKNLKVLLAALTMVDRLYLQTNKGKVPPVYRSGIRYEEEADGRDDWQDIPTTLALKKGDAEDLACWRAAELQEQGVMAWPTLEFDHGCLHPRVRYPNGRIEDPAKMMGMGHHTKPCLAIRTPGTRETPIAFVMDVFHGSRVPQQKQALAHRTLRLLLGALTIIDCDILRRYPMLPRLYDPRMAVYYEVEPNGREDWQDVLTNFRRKSADCEDLASHRAAELQVKDGLNAWPCFTYKVRRTNGSHLYHIQTRYPDGSIEDPSRILGMGQNTGV
jgi:hypothetical protein